jgi:hypothetical protein
MVVKFQLRVLLGDQEMALVLKATSDIPISGSSWEFPTSLTLYANFS